MRLFPIEFPTPVHGYLFTLSGLIIFFSFIFRMPFDSIGLETVFYAFSSPFLGIVLKTFSGPPTILATFSGKHWWTDNQLNSNHPNIRTAILVLLNLFLILALGRSGEVVLQQNAEGDIYAVLPTNCFGPHIEWTAKNSVCLSPYVVTTNGYSFFDVGPCATKTSLPALVVCNFGLQTLRHPSTDNLAPPEEGRIRVPRSEFEKPRPARPRTAKVVKTFHWPWELNVKDMICLIIIPAILGYLFTPAKGERVAVDAKMI